MTTREGQTTGRTPKFPRGGVHPMKKKGAVIGVKLPVVPKKEAAPTPGAFPGFTSNGGPVISSPIVYTSFWGLNWQADASHQQLSSQISQYHADLLQSNFMNMLSQYGVGTGAGSGTVVNPAIFVSTAPTTLTQDSIQTTIQSLIDQQSLPEPATPTNNVLMVYLDETIGVEDPANQLILCEPTNDDAFGFHSFFTTTEDNPFYYAIIPFLADACLQETCSDDSRCSLHVSQNQLDRITQVASHEFAEMTTDPQLNAWSDQTDTDPQGNPVGENGDICNGQSDTITVGAKSWNVQRIYSKYDDMNSNGATFCVAQVANPEPAV